MKSKVKGLRVRGYTFSGYITPNGEEMRIEGEYRVTFKRSYPAITVTDVDLADTLSQDLKEFIDLTDLEAQILETDDGTWYDDFRDSIEESKYSVWRDE